MPNNEPSYSFIQKGDCVFDRLATAWTLFVLIIIRYFWHFVLRIKSAQKGSDSGE